MTDWLLAALADYGVILLFLTAFASCLAVPVPSSLLMLSGGAFAATGDLPLASVVGAALAGAVLGDQAGFGLGRSGRAGLNRLLAARPKSQALMARAEALIERRGGIGVFLSRWLFSPLGPYVNLAGGATGQAWLSFTLWGGLGEAVWVGLYVGLGRVFAGNLQMAADLAGNLLGLLAALAVMAVAGWWMMQTLHKQRAQRG